MLKEYHKRESTGHVKQASIICNCFVQELGLNSTEKDMEEDIPDSSVVLKNSDILNNLKDKLYHIFSCE